ncbi:MAG: diaminopimelate epimerase [Bacteroidales bacterium]|nr:diaminopimelate epimerase [Bacteroidales bacterium]
MSRMHFTKMHGLGNDFVLIDCRSVAPDDLGALAVRLCDRRRGVGADGLLVLQQSDVADCRMRIFNADGSEAAMCGNGIRCIACYARRHGIVSGTTALIETMSGLRDICFAADGLVTVDMGVPRVASSDMTLDTACGGYKVISVSTGNPHGVVFVDRVGRFDVSGIGPLLECHPVWPDRANIEFVEPVDRHMLRQRTWERGVGETDACGTGACAAAAAAVAHGLASWPVIVDLNGGRLHIDVSPSGHMLMTGPAVEVFDGATDI